MNNVSAPISFPHFQDASTCFSIDHGTYRMSVFFSLNR
jgi:hypothetical protein